MQGEYFDIPTSTLTPVQIREKLAALAASVIGDSVAGDFSELLKLKSTPNGGVTVTDDLKYTSKCCSIRECSVIRLAEASVHSQILPAEWRARLADGTLGWPSPGPSQQLVAREGVVRVPRVQGHRLNPASYHEQDVSLYLALLNIRIHRPISYSVIDTRRHQTPFSPSCLNAG